MSYDTSLCSTDECEANPEIHLQIGSSIRTPGSVLPKFHSWVSLTPGSEFVDLAQHPAVIQARFDSANGRIGELIVRADIVSSNGDVTSVTLTDSGSQGKLKPTTSFVINLNEFLLWTDSDISRDGIYSGLFYPTTDGTYTANIHAFSKDSVTRSERLLTSNQGTMSLETCLVFSQYLC